MSARGHQQRPVPLEFPKSPGDSLGVRFLSGLLNKGVGEERTDVAAAGACSDFIEEPSQVVLPDWPRPVVPW